MRFMLLFSLVFCSLFFASCAKPFSECDNDIKQISGIVFVAKDGLIVKYEDEDCPIAIYYDFADSEEIAGGFSESKYDGVFRPVRVQFDGEISIEVDGGGSIGPRRIFEVKKIKTVDYDVSYAEAKKAAKVVFRDDWEHMIGDFTPNGEVE